LNSDSGAKKKQVIPNWRILKNLRDESWTAGGRQRVSVFSFVPVEKRNFAGKRDYPGKGINIQIHWERKSRPMDPQRRQLRCRNLKGVRGAARKGKKVEAGGERRTKKEGNVSADHARVDLRRERARISPLRMFKERST